MIIPYPHMPPVLVVVGPCAVRWYGVMYLVGYCVGYRIMRARIERGLISLTRRDLDSLIGYLLAGMVLGARLMYAIVYEPGHYLGRPRRIRSDLARRPVVPRSPDRDGDRGRSVCARPPRSVLAGRRHPG